MADTLTRHGFTFEFTILNCGEHSGFYIVHVMNGQERVPDSVLFLKCIGPRTIQKYVASHRIDRFSVTSNCDVLRF